jgi:cytochrome c-type biogenesis protein CcmH
MVGFWISASVMIAAALAFLLPPLIGRVRAPDVSRDAVNLAIYRERRQELDAQRDAGTLDAAAFADALAELDRELLHDVGTPEQAEAAPQARSPYPAIAVAVLLPLAAFGLYLQLGTPEALVEQARATASAGGGRTAGTSTASGSELPHSLEEMVAGLARRLAGNPDDPEGWLMLGRSYAAMNRLEDARAALEESDRRRPDHPMTLVALAEVIAGGQGNRLDGEPARLVERALAIDPNFARALWLAGVDAFNRGDRGRAAELWQRLLAVPDLSPEAATRVREALAQTGTPPQADTATAPPAATGGATVTVNVSLDPALAARIEGGETLFVFARAANGPRMPLAIARLSAADLPARVTLDESMAMAPQMNLATFEQVVVGARISRSGNATPSSGDLEGSSNPVAPAQAPEVSITIDRVVQ